MEKTTAILFPTKKGCTAAVISCSTDQFYQRNTEDTFRSISESSLYWMSDVTRTDARTGTIILDSFFLDTR